MMKLEDAMRAFGDDLARRNTIDRAIELVMHKGGLSRTEAHRRMRQLSLTTRKPMEEVARGLLAAAGNA